MTRSEILKRAEAVINGQREQDYGSPESNFGLIGQLWTVYLDTLVTAQDVANLMTLFKIARIKTGRGTEDSYIDAVGYMACGGEIATEDAKNGSQTNYLKQATDAMRPKYIKFVKEQIEKETEKNRDPSVCCCDGYHKATDGNIASSVNIAKIMEENARKWELLKAIFGDFGGDEEDED